MFTMFAQTPKKIVTTSCKFMHHPDTQNVSATSPQSQNFGIFRLSTEQIEPKITKMDWIWNIDRSGSMDERCPDGKTKMQHIHHTLQNMINYFLGLSPTICQTLTIIGFDHEIDIICEKVTINDELKTNLPQILGKLTPRGATNIGAALTVAKDIIDSNTSPDTHTMHIFMSDGQITTGEHDKPKLVDKLVNNGNNPNTKCKHAFVGFGIHHDDKLLRHLSDATNGDYYFIDSLENAGMVYGEILYVGLYEYIQNLTVEIENGEFYNYKTNDWSKTLMVDSIASGQTRTWHVRANEMGANEMGANEMGANEMGANEMGANEMGANEMGANEMGANEMGANEMGANEMGGSAAPLADTQHTDTQHADTHHTDTHLHISINGTYKTVDDQTTLHTLPPPDIEYPNPGTINKEVEKYSWRQRTQELMHKVKHFISETAIESPTMALAQHRRLNKLYPGSQIPVPSPAIPSPPNLMYDEDMHIILDAAKQGVWSVVYAVLDKNPALINELPYPRNYRLIHQAIYQK